jgi:hypothetical protein
MRHPIDNRVHLSELRMMSKSPAHYRRACEDARNITRPMIVGSVADCIVFGNRGYAVYPGKVRNGAEWNGFQRAHEGEIICITSEYEDAIGAAAAVRVDPCSRALLEADDVEYQVCAEWEAYGLPCAAGIKGERGGFDLVGRLTPQAVEILGFGRAGDTFEADLKITADTEPHALGKHAWRMLWHCQRAFYKDGIESNGGHVDHSILIAVESSPPNVVTVLRVDDEAIDHGRRSICLWAERLRACEASGRWPGYVRRAEALSVPEWERE